MPRKNDSPPLDGSDPEALGRWVVQHGGPFSSYLLALASGQPEGLEGFRKHIVIQQIAGPRMTVDQFMAKLMTYAATGELC